MLEMESRRCSFLGYTQGEHFDAVCTVRCLINITDPKKQKVALKNISHFVKPGGKLLILEGIADGRGEVNPLKSQRLGLPHLPDVKHNVDFPIDSTVAYLKTLFSSVTFEANGIYDLITRVIGPRLIAPKEPEYNSLTNQIAAECQMLTGAMPRLARFGLFVCSNGAESDPNGVEDDYLESSYKGKIGA